MILWQCFLAIMIIRGTLELVRLENMKWISARKHSDLFYIT